MLAGVAGGYLIRKQFENLQEALPQIGRAKGDGVSFKLSVRVISASVPALSSPGVWSRQRPRVQVALGDVQKDTEFADYTVDDNTIGLHKGYECPWRFSETLTFVGRQADVLSSGLRLRLYAHSDFQFGPVQFQFASVTDLGEASVDLRRRALPSCIGHQQGKDGNWVSPVLVIPLSHVRGGKCAAGHGVGEAVAHLTLSFSVDMDPEAILATADAETRGVADVLGRSVDVLGVTDVMNWMENLDLDTPLWQTSSEEQLPHRGQSSELDPFSTLLAPSDLAPDGWISHTAPNGRKFWHNKALGPAPWEKASRADPFQVQAVAPESPPAKPKHIVDAPDQDPSAWVSHKGRDGRIFWHHLGLGPPPWEAADRTGRGVPLPAKGNNPPNSSQASWRLSGYTSI